MTKDHQWHKTADVLPAERQGVVAGLWTDDEGAQYVTLCHYENKDNLWYEDVEDKNDVCTVLKAPDYWIDVPEPEK